MVFFLNPIYASLEVKCYRFQAYWRLRNIIQLALFTGQTMVEWYLVPSQPEIQGHVSSEHFHELQSIQSNQTAPITTFITHSLCARLIHNLLDYIVYSFYFWHIFFIIFSCLVCLDWTGFHIWLTSTPFFFILLHYIFFSLNFPSFLTCRLNYAVPHILEVFWGHFLTIKIDW